MVDKFENEIERVARVIRQRLESLRRAGVDRIAVPMFPVVHRTARPRPKLKVEESSPPVQPPVATGPVLDKPAVRPPVQEVARPKPAPAPPLPMPVASLFGETGFDVPPLPSEARSAELAALTAEVAGCVRCPLLASTRTQTVFGTGSPTARLMFIGEAPGAEEDRTGLPFVGRAGMLLTDMITKGMGLTREQVYIANVLKSRPPENRNPLPEEMANCLPFLERQINIIRPEFLCLLGKVSASALLETALPIGKLRGRWHRYRGIPTIVTYHPSYLLRTPSAKKEAWDDLQLLMNAMGLTPPSRKRS